MDSGFKKYTKNLWNIVDFCQVSAYLAAISLRTVVWLMPPVEPPVTNRGQMSSSDPMLISESCFATANVVSILKLLTLFISNSELGPLQITLGRMMIDVVKFMFIFFLVLLSFASGLNQLLYLEYGADGAVSLRWHPSLKRPLSTGFGLENTYYLTLMTLMVRI